MFEGDIQFVLEIGKFTRKKKLLINP